MFARGFIIITKSGRWICATQEHGPIELSA